MSKKRGFKDYFENVSKEFDRINKLNPGKSNRPLTLKEQIERANIRKPKVEKKEAEEERFIQDCPHFSRNLPFVK